MNSRIVVAFALALLVVAASNHAAVAQGAGANAASRAPSAAVGNAVVAQEQLVLDAIARSDTAGFNKALGRDFVYVDGRGAMRWSLAKTSSMFAECGLGTGWTLDHPMTTEVGNDLVVLTYSSSGKQECKGQRSPSPVYTMSVWQKRGARWVAIAHSETPAAPSQAKP
jgi:hypothetical protein